MKSERCASPDDEPVPLTKDHRLSTSLKPCGGLAVSVVLPLLAILILFAVSCGRKAPPTLKAYEKPKSPSGLEAVHREDEIVLSWSYPRNLRDSVKGFAVLRSLGEGPFERVGSVKSDQSFFSDGAFETGREYRYKVVALNPKGIASGDSNVVSAVPLPIPPPPEDVRFRIGADSVELSWGSAGQGICYNIYRSLERGKFGGIPLNAKPVCNTYFGDSELFPDATVYYEVRSLHDTVLEDEGYASKVAAVTPSDFVPEAPTDLRIVKDAKVYLAWSASAEKWVSGYRVFRKIEGENNFTLLGEVKVPAFTDTTKTDKKVLYMIKAVGPVSESEPLTGEVR